MGTVRIEVLGGFRVTVAGAVVPDVAWRRRKAAALVKILSLAPRHRLRRQVVMAALWPELGADAAAANLRKAVHFARRAAAGTGVDLVGSAGELLCLPAERLWVDVAAFRSDLVAARGTQEYATLVDRYGGGLLPDDGDEWVLQARSDLDADYAVALADYAAVLEDSGDLAEAARIARRLVDVDPLVEESHVRLIRILGSAGRRSEALVRFRTLRAVLRAELGVDPGREAQRLVDGLRGPVSGCHCAVGT